MYEFHDKDFFSCGIVYFGHWYWFVLLLFYEFIKPSYVLSLMNEIQLYLYILLELLKQPVVSKVLKKMIRDFHEESHQLKIVIHVFVKLSVLDLNSNFLSRF